MTGPPEYDFTAGDGVAHTVWVIRDPAEIREVAEGFAPVDALYIADGHHRAAAAARSPVFGRRGIPADGGTRRIISCWPSCSPRISSGSWITTGPSGI